MFRLRVTKLKIFFFFLTTELTSPVKPIVSSTPAKPKRSRKGKRKERKKADVSDEEDEQARKRTEEDALDWNKQLQHGNMFNKRS